MSKYGKSATGLASVQAAKGDLTRFLKTLDSKPVEILEEESQRLYAEIIAETPFEDGRLEASVRVRVSRDKSRPGILASASAKNPETGYDYAAIQHENIEFVHPIKGKAHYIKDPFNRCVQRIERRFKDDIKIGGK